MADSRKPQLAHQLEIFGVTVDLKYDDRLIHHRNAPRKEI